MDGTNGFLIGCNYWASHAGTYMWRNWDENVVTDDLKKLAACGIGYLRVFPLWPDFQPLTRYVNSGIGREMRINDQPLDRTPEGVAGVDPVMIQRFCRFLELCKQNDIKVIVCLLNGWMSGRMFYPPAFQNTNVILNKTAVKWEIRFVKYFVNRFKSSSVIVAWEPGNETNVLRGVEELPMQNDEYYVWLSAISNAIRAVDNTRPVISGIHGLQMYGVISPSDVGEICDVTTVHPYPAFVPHCFIDGLTSMRSRLHATAESVFYSDLGGVPCLCEEIGTLGNMLGCEETASNYIRASVHSLWACGATGIMWWCGFDQKHLSYPPYDWCGVERELGLIRSDGQYKQVAEVFRNMADFTQRFGVLPLRKRDAVCILTKGQDQWGVAYSSYIMAKQAGFELQFADGEYDIPQSNIYLLPSLGGDGLPRRTQNELLRRVRDEGAVLYVSCNDAIISSFEEIFGCHIQSNQRRAGIENLTILHNKVSFRFGGDRKLLIKPDTCDVLAVDDENNPALICNSYGEGKIYFLNFAPEQYLAEEPNAFECEDENSNYLLYDYLFRGSLHTAVIEKSSPYAGVTEHLMDDGSLVLAVINYADHDLAVDICLKHGLYVDSVAYGTAAFSNNTIHISLGCGEMCLLNIKNGEC